MANLKIKMFNNFQDVQNVVKDGKKVTTDIKIEDSPSKDETPRKPPKPPDKDNAKFDAGQLSAMIDTGRPDIPVLRKFLLSLSSDLPELISRLVTASEAARVLELISAVSVKEELYREDGEVYTEDREDVEPQQTSEDIAESMEQIVEEVEENTAELEIGLPDQQTCTPINIKDEMCQTR